MHPSDVHQIQPNPWLGSIPFNPLICIITIEAPIKNVHKYFDLYVILYNPVHHLLLISAHPFLFILFPVEIIDNYGFYWPIFNNHINFQLYFILSFILLNSPFSTL